MELNSGMNKKWAEMTFYAAISVLPMIEAVGIDQSGERGSYLGKGLECDW
jgi:hypothetical protein